MHSMLLLNTSKSAVETEFWKSVIGLFQPPHVHPTFCIDTAVAHLAADAFGPDRFVVATKPKTGWTVFVAIAFLHNFRFVSVCR